jgi:hypothetical protein
MAHDPEMIAILQKIADSGEADIAKLEAVGHPDARPDELESPPQVDAAPTIRT